MLCLRCKQGLASSSWAQVEPHLCKHARDKAIGHLPSLLSLHTASQDVAASRSTGCVQRVCECSKICSKALRASIGGRCKSFQEQHEASSFKHRQGRADSVPTELGLHGLEAGDPAGTR